QPTAEQLRIASMTAVKTDADPEMMKKIKEVSDLTGRSADEAYTALHDCNGDANQAVDLLFEKTNNQVVLICFLINLKNIF
ncbi:hypothetical protein HELRODRAFT_81752, partial [Helobdella robusta]|uniref:UBA-like domain-containing protein n=1 Tax=Helobdella robusta TaxID=6412 RepID=T1G4I4_HELRO